MRIALVHNPNAGTGEFAPDDFRRLLEDEGHRVEVFGKKKRDVKEAIASGADLLAVAGGDGTVARAAIVSHKQESAVPLLILPAGTSNNIARSLGIDRAPDELIRNLGELAPGALDIGRVSGKAKGRFFVEGAGVGFVGALLRHPPSVATRAVSAIRGVLTGAGIQARIARGVAAIIRKQRPLALSVTADGVDLGGEFIAIEALNIREIGPRLRLAPEADCGDGMLDLVLYGAADAERLAGAVERQGPSPQEIRSRRVQRIEMTWRAGYAHVDDKPWPRRAAQPDMKVTLAVAGRVSVLKNAKRPD